MRSAVALRRTTARWLAIGAAGCALATLAFLRLQLDGSKETELRVLQVPSASLHAVWLHGSTDRFVAVRVSGHEVVRLVMDSEELLASVATRIPERLNATGDRGA